MEDRVLCDESAGKFHTSRWTFVTLFFIALGLRAAWGIYALARSSDPNTLEFPDEQQYWLIASSLRFGGGLTDELGFHAGRMPLYPAILAMFAGFPNGVIAAKVLHWLVGALAAPLTTGVAGTMCGRRGAWLAGMIVACDPFLVFTSSLLLTETFFTIALIGLWRALATWFDREVPNHGTMQSARRWFVVAALSALCIYMRESSVGLVIAMLFLGIVISARRGRTAFQALGVVAFVLAALLPWALRNRAVTGEMCWLTLRGGISLYDGVHEGATGASDLGVIKWSDSVKGLPEAEYDRYFRNKAWLAIRENPSRIATLAVAKAARMWNPVPNVGTHRSPGIQLVAAAWSGLTFILALIGLIRVRNGCGLGTVVFLVLPIAYFTILHSVFVGSVRYRLPVLPMVAVLAGCGLAGIISHRHSTGAVEGVT